jgi:hypothetical protein
MSDLTPIDQAKKAIRHTLVQIKENPVVGYHLGEGTQTFDLLTEAFATLSNGKFKVSEVRESFDPSDPKQVDQETAELLVDIHKAFVRSDIGERLSHQEVTDLLSRINDIIGHE